MKRSLLLCLFAFNSAAGNPWGKDADLAAAPIKQENTQKYSPLNTLGQALIRFHQEVISPADGPRSNFKPSSSQYTLNAMQKYGFFRGFIMGCDRLMRENDAPWVYDTVPNGNGEVIKYDPVP